MLERGDILLIIDEKVSLEIFCDGATVIVRSMANHNCSVLPFLCITTTYIINNKNIVVNILFSLNASHVFCNSVLFPSSIFLFVL